MNHRAARRSARLFRLYPRQWRERFPDFEDALAQEILEHPQGVRRNVLRSAVMERLRQADVFPKEPADRARSGLALISACLIPFGGLAMGMWSQLRTGLVLQRTGPSSALQAANLLLTVGTLVVLGTLPIVVVMTWAHSRRMRHERGLAEARRIPGVPLGPFLAFAGSLGALTLTGWIADQSGWYSPAAAALPSQGLGHPATLWVRGIVATITPAWIHPTLFAQMPAGELAAALLAPFGALAAACALFRLIVGFPPHGSSRAQVVVAVTAFGTMCASIAACGRWLLDHPGREGATVVQARADQLAPGHTGWIVALLLIVIAATALVGLRRVLESRHHSSPRS